MVNCELNIDKYSVLGNLVDQLRFSPSDTLLEQSYRAERLIKLIDPAKKYPYDFVCYKLTDYKPREILSPALLSGRELISDLAIFIGQVSKIKSVSFRSLPEKVLFFDDLAEKIGTSTKTLRRWRKRGLAQRLVIDANGKCKSAVLASTWEWFHKKHEKVVAKAGAFTLLSDQQRVAVISQARRLYQQGGLSRHQVELRLADKTGRAKETIRYILTNHDADAGPEGRIFPSKKKLTRRNLQQIYLMHRKGISTKQLSQIFGRSEPTIYRIVNQIRQELWKEAKIDYVFSPEFDIPSAQGTISEAYAGLHIEYDTNNRIKTLTPQQEHILFRTYNFLKWQQEGLLKHYSGKTLPARIMEKLDEWQGGVAKIKNILILANQALIISIAKHHRLSELSMDELISEGLTPLMKSIEKFDFTRGYKFSTYASWAIMKHFARITGQAASLHHQYQLIDREDLELLTPGTTDADEKAIYQKCVAVHQALETLNQRERDIIENRFGLDRENEPLSLSKLGKIFGVSKERVRQLESRAMDKMHEVLARQ